MDLDSDHGAAVIDSASDLRSCMLGTCTSNHLTCKFRSNLHWRNCQASPGYIAMPSQLLRACMTLQECNNGHSMAQATVSKEVKRRRGSSMGCACNGHWQRARLKPK